MDPLFASSIFFLGCLWQLSERVYLSPALGFVGGCAAFGLPRL